MAELKLISAESVTEGHPDKVCDQISDAILDDMLAQDPHSHVAVETCATVGQFFVFGEVTSEGYSDIQNIVRSVVRNIGYTSSRVGLDADSCGVTVSLTEQSPEINQGVARLSGEEESKASREQRYEAQGAGDQGVMFGYACDETDVLMPLPIHLAHRLAYRLAEVRKSGEVPHLRPDGKTQVTIEYDDDDHPVRLDTVLVSTQHDPEVDQAWLKEQLTEHVIRPVLDDVLADPSSTPTAALPTMAAARSPARIRARWIVPRPMRHAGWPRTSWPPALPTRSRCRSPTPSAWPIRCPSTWRPTAPRSV